MPRDPKGQLVEKELLTLPVWDQFDQGTQRAILRLVRSAGDDVLGGGGSRTAGEGAETAIVWGRQRFSVTGA